MKAQLAKILEDSKAEIQRLADLKALEDFKVRVLGRKGVLTQLLHGLKDLPDAVRYQRRVLESA